MVQAGQVSHWGTWKNVVLHEISLLLLLLLLLLVLVVVVVVVAMSSVINKGQTLKYIHINAAEAEISNLLVPFMNQAEKKLDPTLPIMQLDRKF